MSCQSVKMIHWNPHASHPKNLYGTASTATGTLFLRLRRTCDLMIQKYIPASVNMKTSVFHIICCIRLHMYSLHPASHYSGYDQRDHKSDHKRNEKYHIKRDGFLRQIFYIVRFSALCLNDKFFAQISKLHKALIILTIG